MKIKIINELAPAPATGATPAAPPPGGTPPAAPPPGGNPPPAGAPQPHPIDPTLLPIIKKQFIDALNPTTNAVLKAAIDKTITDILAKVMVK